MNKKQNKKKGNGNTHTTHKRFFHSSPIPPTPIKIAVYRIRKRRKFRNQNSDSWTDAATVVTTVKEKDSSRKKVKAYKKVQKSRTIFVFCHAAPEGRKIDSKKRPAWNHLVGWEIENRMRLWREHRSVKIKKHKGFWALLEVQPSTKCTLLWREAQSH